VAALGVFALIVLIALFAPALAPHDPLQQNLGDNFKPPMWQEGGTATYPLGTDPLGRDLLSRLIYGARYSLLISISAVLLGAALGFVVGIAAGFFGGWTDTVLMRLGDIQLAFPFVLFAIAVLAVSPERTPLQIIIVLGVSSWVTYARVVRSRVLSEREKDYARAAKALGASRWRVLTRYVMPNVWQVIPPIAMLTLGFFVIVESLLSFLALGLSPPTPSWGAILADGRQYMMLTPWMALLPGLAILVTVLSVSLAADGLADMFDPKLAQGVFRRVPLALTPLPPSPTAVRRGGNADVEMIGIWHPIPTSTAPSPSALGEGVGGEGQRGAGSGTRSNTLLSIRNLHTIFPTAKATVHALRGVDFELARGQVLGVVGESGSGKSTLGLSIIQLLDAPGRVVAGEILFQGRDLARISNAAMEAIRGTKVGMIFQDPANSLTPVLTVGYQLRETIRANRKARGMEVKRLAREALVAVQIPDPDRVLRAYPFQLSGGMQQRVMIALAMIGRPDLLILDEPTSALDVTTQAQFLDELERLRQNLGTSILFITHDISLLADFADQLLVLYAGQVCESGPRDAVLDHPQHPYTRALLDAVSRTGGAGGRLAAIPGDPPDPTHVPPGCPFAPRCPLVMPVCWEVNPALVEVEVGHRAACHVAQASGAAFPTLALTPNPSPSALGEGSVAARIAPSGNASRGHDPPTPHRSGRGGQGGEGSSGEGVEGFQESSP
jgi:peptide/nickel transport system permease protein